MREESSRFINNSIARISFFFIGQEAILYGKFNEPHGLRYLTYCVSFCRILPVKNVCAMIQYSAITEILMSSKNDNLPVWIKANAWREIFARIFERMEVKNSIFPEWLVNPATNRRLKLDLLYPEIGVAVRLEGVEGKQRRQRPSLEEEEQQRVRLQARADVCRTHDIELIVVNVGDPPRSVFRAIDEALSRAGQRVRNAERAKNAEVLEKVSQARAVAANLSRRIKHGRDLNLYADLWQDRLYQIPELDPTETPAPTGQAIVFVEGMEVEHPVFGPGVVLAVTPGGEDTLILVDFVTAGQKTLAASLVADKLIPR